MGKAPEWLFLDESSPAHREARLVERLAEQTRWETWCIRLGCAAYEVAYRVALPVVAVLWATYWAIRDAWVELDE